MNVNEKIKVRRQELGLTDVEVAKLAGLSIQDYFSIEMHVDEIVLYPHLYEVKEILKILKIDFFDLFEMHCDSCEEDKQYPKDYSLPRNELIHKRRTEMGLSASELGDRIGFEEAAVNDMEKDPNYLETWAIDYIKDLSRVIDVPLQILLNIKCAKCGH